MIHFSNFSKAYSGQVVLSIANRSINDGLYWLKGENGTGKSTLMRCMAGLVPYSGNITVNGHSINKNRIDYCRQIRYAEAEPVYPSFISATDLITFYIDSGVCTRDAIKQYSTLFGVNEFAAKATGTYSSGMLKKLSLVLCLAANSQILLFDEPLITLDVASCNKLLQCFAALAATGKTIILTSHQDMFIPGLEATVLTIHNGTLL